MSNRIEAPGHSALWTEAALRCLGSTAYLIHEDGRIQEEGGVIGARAAKDIALDAMAIATAFEAACVAAHEAEQEARRERVRTIGRFRFISDAVVRTVASVEGDAVTFVQIAGEVRPRTTTVEHVLDPECYEPAPLDALAPPTTGGEER